MLPHYGKFPCNKVAQHWEFHFLFHNSAILHSCNFGFHSYVRWKDRLSGSSFPSDSYIESYTNINLCPVFYLKAYLRCTEPFSKKPDGSHVTSLFLGNNRQHRPVCAKTLSSWVRKVLSVAKAHMSPGSLWGLQLLQPECLVFPWCPSCKQGLS